jgi:hypothetical protein
MTLRRARHFFLPFYKTISTVLEGKTILSLKDTLQQGSFKCFLTMENALKDCFLSRFPFQPIILPTSIANMVICLVGVNIHIHNLLNRSLISYLVFLHLGTQDSSEQPKQQAPINLHCCTLIASRPNTSKAVQLTLPTLLLKSYYNRWPWPYLCLHHRYNFENFT